MIVVTEVKTVTTPRDTSDFVCYDRTKNIAFTPDPLERQRVIEGCNPPEGVRGTLFDDGRGNHVMLGFTQQAKDALGQPLECFEEAQLKAEYAERAKEIACIDLRLVRTRLADVANLSFLGRLRFLLTRKV